MWFGRPKKKTEGAFTSGGPRKEKRLKQLKSKLEKKTWKTFERQEAGVKLNPRLWVITGRFKTQRVREASGSWGKKCAILIKGS